MKWRMETVNDQLINREQAVKEDNHRMNRQSMTRKEKKRFLVMSDNRVVVC